MAIVLLFYRLGNRLHRWHVPLLPALTTLATRLLFAAYIPHSCTIGRKVSFPYGGLGVVLHGQSVIHDRATIAQGVTLGGRSGRDGVPVIGAGAYLGAGSKILGNVVVGPASVVGANAVVLADVPAHGVVAGVPARLIRIEPARPETR